MFREGEWVQLTERSFQKMKLQAAFVIAHGNDTNVKIFVPEDGKERWASRRYLESHEDILPEIKVAARKVFADLALDLKNEEWFREVTG